MDGFDFAAQFEDISLGLLFDAENVPEQQPQLIFYDPAVYPVPLTVRLALLRRV